MFDGLGRNEKNKKKIDEIPSDIITHKEKNWILFMLERKNLKKNITVGKTLLI